MRPIRTAGLAAVLATSVWAATSHGQQPGRQRAAGYANPADSEVDGLLRPYGSRNASAAGRRGYDREPTRVEPTRAVMPPARHQYFPNQRTGQYANHNYIAPERLCVPGRRPFLYR